jgi:chromosome segregation ATPase
MCISPSRFFSFPSISIIVLPSWQKIKEVAKKALNEVQKFATVERASCIGTAVIGGVLTHDGMSNNSIGIVIAGGLILGASVTALFSRFHHYDDLKKEKVEIEQEVKSKDIEIERLRESCEKKEELIEKMTQCDQRLQEVTASHEATLEELREQRALFCGLQQVHQTTQEQMRALQRRLQACQTHMAELNERLRLSYEELEPIREELILFRTTHDDIRKIVQMLVDSKTETLQLKIALERKVAELQTATEQLQQAATRIESSSASASTTMENLRELSGVILSDTRKALKDSLKTPA